MNEIEKFKPEQTLEDFKKEFFGEDTLTLFHEYRSFANRVYHHILSKLDITVTCSPFFVPFVEGKPQAILEINSYGDNPFNPL